MIEVKSIKMRFEKFITETDKSYLLQYKRKKHWLSKKICWDLIVVGNDLHAWAIVPPFIFKKLTGKDIDDVIKNHDEAMLKECFGGIINLSIEKHIPKKIKPKESNQINELKK